MVVLLIITAVSVSFMQSQLRSSATARQRVAAEYRAQAGLNQAIAWFGAWPYVMPQASSLTSSVPVSWTANPVQLPGNHPDTYTDAAGNSQSGVRLGTTGTTQGYQQYFTSPSTNGYSVVASLISQNPEVWELISTGQFGPTQRQAGAIIFRRPIPGLFSDGLFGAVLVHLDNNATTNSYDSSVAGSTCTLNNGDVISNGAISLDNNAIVSGDATAGPGATPQAKNNAVITGTPGSETSPKALPTIAVPPTPSSVPSPDPNVSGTLTLGPVPTTFHYASLTVDNNSTLRFNVPVTLIVDGTIKLDNNSFLYLTGANNVVITNNFEVYNNAQVVLGATDSVTIYVTGIFDVNNNGVIANSGIPQHFQVWDISSTAINLANNATFVGTLYAPNAALTISNNVTYDGAFAARSVDVNNNGHVCYDQTLGTVGWNPGTFRLIMQWLVPSS
jgi:hypothetical protein